MEKTVWIARDKDGDLYLYSKKPELDNDTFTWGEEDELIFFSPNNRLDVSCYMQIDSDLYPEVTFENSPKELIIKD